MKKRDNDLIGQNKVFAWIAIATGLVLLLPLMAMTFDWSVPEPGENRSDKVYWTLSDFIIMGTLMFGSGSIFVLMARRVPKKYRLFLAAVVTFLFLLVWAELAVGVLTNIGG